MYSDQFKKSRPEVSSNPGEPSDPIMCVRRAKRSDHVFLEQAIRVCLQSNACILLTFKLCTCVRVRVCAQRINATGPGPKVPSNPGGPKDPKTWGWYRHSESSFGYVRLVTKTGEDGDASMRVEFVRSYAVEHEPVVDENGRSLHVPLVSAPSPYICCWSVHFLSTCVAGQCTSSLHVPLGTLC